jgi:hypothetical protein
VQREAVQDLGRGEPAFEELGGELHVVAGDRGAGQRRVADARVEAVQRVAELVEERVRVVPRDQDRLPRLPLHEVRVVGDDGRDVAVEALLVAVGVHPGAGLLARTRVGVEIPQAHLLAGRVGDLVDAHVRLVDGDAVDGAEAEAEELARHPEHPRAQLLELQVRLDLVLVEVVLRLADLLRVVAVVPGLDLDLRTLLVRHRLHVGDLLADAGDGGLPHRLHQLHRPLRRAGHRVLEPPVGVSLEAEEFRPLGPQLEDLGDDRVVVLGVAVVAAAVVGAPDLLAQVAPVRVGEERLHAGPRVEDGPLALLAALLGGGGGGRAQRVGQAGEVGLLVEEEHVVGLVGEEVLAELRVEGGQPLVDLGHPLLGHGVELRPRAHEVRVVEPGQPLLLGRELRRVPRVVDGGDALEELLVLGDLVGEGGQLRGHLRLDLLELRRAHRVAVDAVDRAHPVQRPPRALQCGQRVLEGRRRGVVCDLVDLGELLGHGGLEGGLQELDLDLVEGRDTAVGSGPRGQQGVLHVGLRGCYRDRTGGRDEESDHSCLSIFFEKPPRPPPGATQPSILVRRIDTVEEATTRGARWPTSARARPSGPG